MTVAAPPEITIHCQKPHKAQRQMLREARRFNVAACGRRFGKTKMGIQLLVPPVVLSGYPVGWFAPTYKLLDEAWAEMLELFSPLGKRLDVSKQERKIGVPGGGRIDFWTLAGVTSEMSQAGRGRKYKLAVVDEAAHARYLEADWTKSIRPTLTDLKGTAWFLSTPRGQDYFWKLWKRGEDGGEWQCWQMPTSANTLIDPQEIADAKAELPADAFAQEYMAEFLADAANPFGLDSIRACVVAEMAAGPVRWWGVDLAKSHDWTVAVGLNEAGHVCAFQRWQSDWRNTEARVAAMIGPDTPAYVDSTGVGDPIVEHLQTECRRCEGFKFSQQSKQQLMEGLAVAIQQGTVAYPAGPITDELESFQYEYTRTGVRYTAPDGLHDDCVDALALAVRCRDAAPRPVRIQFVGSDPDEEAWEQHWSESNPGMWR